MGTKLKQNQMKSALVERLPACYSKREEILDAKRMTFPKAVVIKDNGIVLQTLMKIVSMKRLLTWNEKKKAKKKKKALQLTSFLK